MCAISADIATAMSTASFWESVEYWSLGAVTLGVMGEYSADFTRLKKSEYWKHRVEKWSTLLVIVALAVELLATVKTNSINNLTIADLGKKAQEAAQLAGQLGVKVDELPTFVAQKKVEIGGQIDDLKSFTADQKRQSDALIASLNAAQAKATISLASIRADEQSLTASVNTINDLRQKLHELTTDRVLSEQQSKALAEKSKSQRHIAFDAAAALASEPYNFAMQIGLALKAAGWDWKPRHMFPSLSMKDIPDIGNDVRAGLVLESCKSDVATLDPLARAIRDELFKDGFSFTGTSYPDEDATTRHEECGRLHIIVGSKY
jgi:hypothetical protein